MQQCKKLCALLLALCMIVGFMPVTTHAALLAGEDYITQQLYLGEDLVLHLRGDVPEEYRDGSTATLTYAGNTDSYTIDDLTPDENGLYDLPVELNVAQMTEDINLVLKAKVGLISMEAINETYSIREYLKTLIEGNYTRETKLLSQELLNYGAWAQKYFNYKTDDLANKGYDITVSNPVPDEIPTVSFEGAVPGVNFYGVSVRFLSKTAVRFYFVLENGVDGLTFTVDGKTYTPVSKDGMYYIEVSGVNPQYMDTDMVVSVTDGTNALSFAYAPTDYFVRKYHQTEDANLKGLTEAAYSYFIAAKEFEGVTDTGKLTFEYKEGNATSIQVNTNLPADITLADFALSDNGCEVNEDANTKKASNVGMTNVDGTIVLTFNFAEAFTAGETYSLPKNAFFCFTDNSQFALADNYLFQFNGTDWTQVEATGDFQEGVGFEEIGNTLRFSGEGPSSKAATVTRVAHNTEIPALENGGDYALKLSHASSYYPTFRINFGKELAAGTKLSFMAFGVVYGDSTNNYGVFEFNNGGDATVQFTNLEWTRVVITLPETADHIDLFWNFERAGLTDASTTGAVYVDNFEAVQVSGDFLEGINFEQSGNELRFEPVGGDYAGRDAIAERVSYAAAGVNAPVNGGSYALKLSHASNYWPTFRINFGKELAAGTTLTFDAYGKINGESTYNKSIFEFVSGGEATAEFSCDAWKSLTITLAEAADHVDLFWNIDRAGITSESASGELYIDNILAIEPTEVTGDFLEGVDFETAGNELLFAGIGGDSAATVTRVAYSFVGVTAPENGGSHALKVSHASNCWPNFRVDFGKTLKAGTTITFDVYGNYDYAAAEGANKYFKVELAADSKNYATSAEANQVVWTLVETWKTGVTVTLTADSDHLDLFYNVADGSHGDVASWLLLDNFKAVEPMYITDGYDFETSGDAAAFTGITENTNIETVSYADAGVSAPENGGSYALKVSHASNCWPNFRVDFGKTLKAGTTITFDVYGNYDYAAAEGVNKYFKVELTADSKNYATSAEANQVVWTLVETWKTGVTVTLTADSDHVDLFYNVADGSHGDVASWILLDNFKAVEPVDDITDGYDFETSGDAAAFTGITENTNIETVSYADAGVSAPENGGSYALKVSHASNCWPNFRVDFGKTLKAGTTITFDVYGNYDYAAAEGVNKYFKVELTADSKNYATSAESNQVVWTLVETWKTGVTITLTADSDHVDLFYNVADGSHGDVASWILLDNIKAVEPMYITDGYTFETADNAEAFSGITENTNIETVSYADAGVSAPENGGSYALKVSHASNCWPNFRVNFGKTLKAGTTITFDVYGNYDYAAAEGVNKYFKVELTADSKNYATSADSSQLVWTLVETWKTGVTITLTADSDHVDLFYNVADGSHGDVASWILLDNFKAVEPLYITDGYTFETAGSAEAFSGITENTNIETVSYADAGVSAPENGGSYALKVSHASNCWPNFRVNFGKTLKAGTTITFDVYGNYDYAAAEGVNKYFKVELTADSKNYATSADSSQLVWTLVETWKTGVTITLTADSDHVDLFYNVADGSHGDVASWILLDNIKAVEPA